MTALSPLNKNGEEMEDIATGATNEFFQYFFDENDNSNDFFDAIDFHDLFDDDEGDGANVLLELEAVDREVASEFSSSGGYGLEGNGVYDEKKLEEDKQATRGEKKNKEDGVDVVKDRDVNRKLRRKSTKLAQSKNPNGKRKQKVDWTPELHKRFVQAVEQLGLDKAVPSKILELMKIDCLTRHNVASHLQKYRLQRKHMLAREAESAAWNRKRQIYGSEGGKRDPPTMGFPPPSPTSIYHHSSLFHVWGHPNPNHPTLYPWPRHPIQLPPPLPPPPGPWTTTIPCFSPQLSLPPNHLYWLPYHRPRFNVPPPVPGIPSITKTVEMEPDSITRSASPPHSDFSDSLNEDETIGDIFLKPRLPLPLGLKPPSLDGVLEELQRQGISTIPPVDP